MASGACGSRLAADARPGQLARLAQASRPMSTRQSPLLTLAARPESPVWKVRFDINNIGARLTISPPLVQRTSDALNHLSTCDLSSPGSDNRIAFVGDVGANRPNRGASFLS